MWPRKPTRNKDHMSIESPQHHQKKDVKTPSKTEAARAVFPETKSREGFTPTQKIAGTVLALGLLGGGAAAANYLSSQNETVTTAPDENEGKGDVTTTQPTPEVTPSDLPTSFTSTSAEATPSTNPETQSPAGDYNISEAEYQNIVKSFKIDVATHPTAESALAAFNERMTLFYNGGNTTKDFTKHAEWLHPVDSSVNPGWNSWATQVYTAAAKEALFVPGYVETPNSYLPYMQERKRAVNGLWINSIDENETPYVMSYEFTPTGIARLANGDFTAYGSSTLTDNANEIPGAKTDSRAIFSKTLDSQAITAVIQDDQWLIHSIETK